MHLTTDAELEQSTVVANTLMNRERRLPGYNRELGLITASATTWHPDEPFDLITCVHGLHYIGDKLTLLTRIVTWLAEDGLFVANFDTASIRLEDGAPAGRRLTAALRSQGLTYDTRTKRIRCTGPRALDLPYRYLGADDQAGPNYTGQPAVDSYYAQEKPVASRRTGGLS